MTEINPAKRGLIADRLKEARKLAGLSQGHVARMLGLHRPSVSEIEAGNRRGSSRQLPEPATPHDLSVAPLPRGGARFVHPEHPPTGTCPPGRSPHTPG